MRAAGAANSAARERALLVAQLPVAEALRLDPDQLADDLAALDADDLEGAWAALLHLARVLEPPMRFTERTAALDRVRAADLDQRLRRQLDAERALDLVRENRLNEAELLASDIIEAAPAGETLAASRATEVLGWVNAWRGTTAAAGRARSLLRAAADRYAELGAASWQGNAMFLLARTVDYQRGELAAAESGMRASLPLLGARRQAVVLTFLGDLMGSQGRMLEAHAVLAEAAELASGETAVLAYVSWSLAKLASYVGDTATTVRLIEETDRDLATLGIRNTVATFAAEAAEMLDRVAERDLAEGYLQRAVTADPDDEFVRLATAGALALHGDPGEALAALRQVLLEPWMERRLVWRVTLLTAWAALRRGDPEAGELARRALAQALELGGVEVAMTTEPTLTRALLPLAEDAGSTEAAALLHPGAVVVRLLGRDTVRLGGAGVAFPTGLPGELARLVLSSGSGRSVDEVVEVFWPDEEPATARRRLRQVLSRLGARLPGLLERQGERLVGVGWVDLIAFQAGAEAALSSGSIDRAQAALALWTGLPLATDAYSAWAVTLRERLMQQRVRLLDLLADDASARGSYDEERRHLEAAIADDRHDETRYERVARLHLGNGQRPLARRALAHGRTMLSGLDVPEPAAWGVLQREIDAPD